MRLEQQNILFISRTMEVGGTEKVVLQLCSILKGNVHKIIVCSNGGSYVSKLEAMDIKHYTIPDLEAKSPHAIVKTYSILKKILRNEKITIVHTHHRMAAFYARMLFSGHNFIHIASAHSLFKNKRYLTKYSYGKAHLIACGAAVRDNLIRYFGVSEDRVCLIHNSVEEYKAAEEVVPELQEWKDQGYRLIGNVSRLEPKKGMEYFIRSFCQVKEACEKVKYVIVGDGSEAARLKELVRSLGLEQDILFMGRRDDVRNIMKNLDVIVLSSFLEGYPLTPLEAFSVGKTIVAARIAGTTEIVTDEKNGILVKPKDSVSLADGIKEVLMNPEKKEMLEKNAYRTYCEQNSFSVFSERVLNYYQNL